jgi:hypothetical protein
MMPVVNETAATARGEARTLFPRRFDFQRDAFDFANELVWEYLFDNATGAVTFRRRQPKPAYTHRCFVLTRAARLFLYHARFEPGQPMVDASVCRRLIRQVLARNPRQPSPESAQVVIPGFASLRDFSRKQEALLKAECGGAWRSYVLRSHWRMVFPISRAHQARTAAALQAALARGDSPIMHLVVFPRLTMNHGMVLFDCRMTRQGLEFDAYDPNSPQAPARLTYAADQQTFRLPANSYWAGGDLDVIEIYRGWFL